MSGIATNLLTALLGWLRSAAAWLWTALTGPETDSLMTWLRTHWLPVTIALCVAGLLIDLAVYLVRWRPLTVWASFFRRVRDRGKRRLRGFVPEANEAYDEQPAPEAEAAPWPVMPVEEASAVPLPVPDSAPLTEEPPAAPVRRRRAEVYATSTLRSRATDWFARIAGEEVETPHSLVGHKPEERLESAFQAPFIPQNWQKPERRRRRRSHLNTASFREEAQDEQPADGFSDSDA